MKRKMVESKNSAQVGPEGQTRLVSSTMCNAGFPTYIPSFMIEGMSDKVSMKKGKEENQTKLQDGGTSYL